jgi:hypothetical protein
MALSGLARHRKFLRLKKMLGSSVLARGSLELIWDVCCSNFDDYLGSAEDVELFAEWDGEPGALAKALAEAGGEGCAGFIERDPFRPGWRVHDFCDHAPDYVLKRMEKMAELELAGKTISDIRRDAAMKRWGQPKGVELDFGKNGGNGVKTDANDTKVDAKVDANRIKLNAACASQDSKGIENKENHAKYMQTDANCMEQHASCSALDAKDPIEKASTGKAGTGKSMGDESTMPPLGAAGAALGGGKIKKRKKPPRWAQPYDADLVETAERIIAIWPNPRKGDVQPSSDGKPVPHIRGPEVAARLDEIRDSGGDLAICLVIAQRKVSEWQNDGDWVNAPQNFFGARGEWKGYYKAYVNSEAGKAIKAAGLSKLGAAIGSFPLPIGTPESSGLSQREAS